MTEKRFTNVGGVEKSVHLVFDNETARTLSVKQTVKKLNEQESTITSLKERNKQLRRRLEWVIEAQEEELKKKDEMISEFIERHSEDIVKISELQATIEYLTKSRDKWRELSNSFLFYCKCYEKAIERAFEEKPCPSEEDINRIYEELEKELDNE